MRHKIGWLFAIMLLFATSANAKMTGTVLDTKEEGIEGVVVKLAKLGFLDTTNYWGEWAFNQPALAAQRAARSKAITGNLSLENGSLSLKFKGMDAMGRGPRSEAAQLGSSAIGARAAATDGPFIDTLIFSMKGKVYKKVGVRSYTMDIPIGSRSGVVDTVNRAVAIPWNEGVKYDTVWNLEDGQPYRTVKIGTQVWMAENLKGLHLEWDANKVSKNIDSTYEFGMLFTWQGANNVSEISSPSLSDTGNNIYDTVNVYHGTWTRQINVAYDAGFARTKIRGACPEGWHVPTSVEFKTMADYINSQNTDTTLSVKNFIRSIAGWPKVKADASSDKYGFRALKNPIYSDTLFANVFWTSTKLDTYKPHYYTEIEGANYWADYKPRYTAFKAGTVATFPVRCVKD